MSRTEVLKFLDEIKKSNGTFFSCHFIKKNGEYRKMVARLGVTKGVKGIGRSYDEVKEYNLLTVYDVQKKGFRRIQLGSIKHLQVKGELIA